MDPLSDDIIRRLVTLYGDFIAENGEAIGTPDLVLPNGDFFPDDFERDAESVVNLLRRMLTYAPLSADLDIRLRFLEEDEAKASSCGPCGCGPTAKDGSSAGAGSNVTETDHGYVIDLNVADVGHATVLTTALARSIGEIVVHEAGEEIAARAIAVRAEIAAVASGFGVILANGAYIYGKSCGGARVVQATRLSLEEHTHLLALFLRHHDIKPSLARSELDTTAREAFDAALIWVDSNREIATALREHPASLAAGYFKIQPARAGLGRIFA
ncbi:MAG: hypothetical protein ABI183_00615 [Polyangiaceae bacterium]